jgi:hypothetical protein
VGAPPLSFGVVALVLEADRDAVAGEAPQVLLQPVVKFTRSFTSEEVFIASLPSKDSSRFRHLESSV